MGLAAWGAHALAMRQGLQQLAEAADHRLEVEATRLAGELARFDYLPALLETSPTIQSLLSSPRDAQWRAAASADLHALNAIAGAEMLYVLAPDGLVVAASDDGEPGSPAGRDLSYRPYLQQALATGRGRLYGLGVTSGVPGYYLSYALPRGGPPQGVATVKIDLRPTEKAWRQMPGQMLALDAHGVVVLTSREDWKYRPRAALDVRALEEANAARRYGEATLAPLDWRELGTRASGQVRLVRVDGQRFVASERAVDEGRWRLVLLSDETPVRTVARWAAGSSALAALAVLLTAMVWRQRRRIVRQQLASRAELQAAHDSLELRVQSRTAELRAAQDELVHAGQLAALGQMSAGMVHELNQPLAALQTLSDNAALLLERGRADEARGNLSRISQLVSRLARLTRQLKVFAHRQREAPVAVSIERAVREAQALHAVRLRELGIALTLDIQPPALAVLAEETRLVQVFTNLIGNAVDALAEQAPQASPAPRIVVRAVAPTGTTPSQKLCSIEVANNGPAIPPEILARIFEPFVSTKRAGQGLGLGLMISAQIARDFGGQLSAHNRAPDESAGMSQAEVVFVLTLPFAPATRPPEP